MEKRIAISLKLPPDLLDQLDAYCHSYPHPPTRTQVIEDAIRAVVAKPAPKRAKGSEEMGTSAPPLQRRTEPRPIDWRKRK